jgi:protease IV
MGPNYLPPKAEPMIMPDANGARELLSGSSPAVLRIDFHGVIGSGDLTGDKITNILLDSRDEFLKGDRVKAIFLHMNTPGGLATDTDQIYRALMEYKTKYKVPIYAYVDGYCASGGMYIAWAADKIFASFSSEIGSVGVVMGPMFNFSDLMTRYGVAALTLTEGKDKDALNPYRPWKPDEDASIRANMAEFYDHFVSIVAAARPQLSKEKLINDYGAQVYTANKALEYGYIDVANSNYSQALSGLAEVAQLGAHYQVVQLIPPHAFFDNLSQSSFTQKVMQWMGFPAAAQPDFSGKTLYLYTP